MGIKNKLPAGIKKSALKLTDETDVGEMTVGEIRKLLDGLNAFVDEQEEARNGRSERWQESDNGQKHEAFLDDVRALRDEVDAANDAISAVERGELWEG